MSVFVLDKHHQPLMPCSEKRARKLLACGRAKIHNLVPFVIRLTDIEAKDCVFQPLKIKLDPGSKVTGIALTREVETINQDGEVKVVVNVLNLYELEHRGQQISKRLTARNQWRKRRRTANLRYREPRFSNRKKDKGWLPPSLRHRVITIINWITKFRKWCPITDVAQELVKFDLQKMDNPEISGMQYQQGTLLGYEIREYLLEKFNRTCSYCDIQNVPLQIEHIHAKSKGGTNRISNLTLACEPCNQKKNAQDIKVFLKNDPKRLSKIMSQCKKPLKDASAVNSTRLSLLNSLKEVGLRVTTGSGGLTKYNRITLKIAKTHSLDAVCVGIVSEVKNYNKPVLHIKCTGRGQYQRTKPDSYGFPRLKLPRIKAVNGFITGDYVKAVVTKGKKLGSYVGRVAVRASGSFNISCKSTTIQGISWKYCKLIQRNNGYTYETTTF